MSVLRRAGAALPLTTSIGGYGSRLALRLAGTTKERLARFQDKNVYILVSKYHQSCDFALSFKLLYTSGIRQEPTRGNRHVPFLPDECVVRRRLGRRYHARAVSAHGRRQARRDVSGCGRGGDPSGGRLLASEGAAFKRPARGR